VSAPEFQPVARLSHSRNVPGRNPPKREMRLSRFLKPLGTIAERFAMPAAMRIFSQRTPLMLVGSTKYECGIVVNSYKTK